jgi:hypothetical protein
MSGCSAPQIPQYVSETPLVKIVTMQKNGSFSGNLQGSHVAYTSDGLQLFDLINRSAYDLSEDTPQVLAWNTSGTFLAAGFSSGSDSCRLIVVNQNGETVIENIFPINLLDIQWSTRGDLLILGYAIKDFSFGSNLSQTLYVVSDKEHVPIILSDNTIKPRTAQILKPILPALMPSAFSAQGDELVYLRLHDPPEFPSFLQVVFRNWQVPVEQLLGRLEVSQTKLFLQEDIEQVATLDVDGTLTTFPLWEDASVNRLGSSGPLEQFSPSRQYRYIGGNLYHNDRLIASWPAGARLQFLRNGRFLLAVDSDIYLGEGLNSEFWPEYNQQEWVLRRWLHHGLITYEDYVQEKSRLLQ